MKTLITSILFLTTLYSYADDDIALRQSCLRDGGKMVDQVICPTSGKVRKGHFCVVKDKMFYNGCTSSIGDYGTIFFQACKLHDYCYHHEPATSGLEKEECDRRFYENMLKICQNKFEFFSCETYAYGFYQAVSNFGSGSWSCSNVEANYPQNL